MLLLLNLYLVIGVPIIKLKVVKLFLGPKPSPVQTKSTRLGLIGLNSIRASSPSNYQTLRRTL